MKTNDWLGKYSANRPHDKNITEVQCTVTLRIQGNIVEGNRGRQAEALLRDSKFALELMERDLDEMIKDFIELEF